MRPAFRHAMLAGALLFTVAADAQKAATPVDSGPLTDANAAYQSGDFEGAREAYAAKVGEGLDGATVLYNLGNAAFRCGRLGEAIAYYQRASRLAPRDRDIAENLRRAYHERQLGEPAPPAMWLHAIGRSLVGSYTLSELAIAAAALYWLAIGLTASRLRGRGGRRMARLLTIIVLSAVALTGLAFARWWGYHHTGAGVVMAEKTEIRSGPGDSFEIVQRVSDGRMVRIVRPNGQWLQVVAEGGARGWLPTSVVAVTQP